jgi:iron(III) transport system ATP-binding protein
MSAVKVADLHHAYGTTPVLRGIDVRLEQGKVTALVGPSGCGKSTLLRCIAGLEAPKSGSIHFDERLVADARRSLAPERRKVGMVFQEPALFPHRTVIDNVAFGLKGADRLERARTLLEQVGLADRADSWPAELSGGQQQRVALARALAPEPTVLLLDEPFSGLDAALRWRLREETRQLLTQRSVTTVVVTHDAEEAMHLGDHLVLLRDGQVLQQGSGEDLWRRPVDPFVAGFFGDATELPGRVAAGAVDWPFLHLPCELPEGSAVRVVLRHEGLGLEEADDPAAGRVLSSRQIGARRLTWVAVAIDGEERLVAVRHRLAITWSVGQRVRLVADTASAFCYPA